MKIRFSILLLLVSFRLFAEGEVNIDSLINLTSTVKNDSILVDLYNDIGAATYRVNPKLSEQYWAKGLALSEKKYESSKSAYFYKEIAKSCNGLGIVNRRQGNMSEALSFYQKSLDVSIILKDSLPISTCYFNIGVIYRDLKDYDKALSYLNKSLDIRKYAGDTVSIAGSYNGIGILFRRQKKYEEAIKYYNKSLEFSAIANDNVNVAQSYNNLAVVMAMQKKYEESLSFFYESYQIDLALNNQAGIAKYYSNIAQVYRRMGDDKQAIYYGEKSRLLFIEMGNKMDLYNIIGVLSKLYKKQGNYKKALEYYKIHIVYRDSIYNERTTKEITQKEMQYEFDKKLLSDSLMRVETEKIKELKHNQEIKEQQTYMYGAGFIILLVVIFSVIIFKRLKESNQQKALIEKQKLIVEEKNTEITDSITYAKRIQAAILPSLKEIKASIPDFFVYYQPKDIVAGDFYWFTKINNQVLIAAADCTGHGVPGAMVSVVCNNALNRAVNDYSLADPTLILDKTAQLVTEAFAKTDEDVKDGMDISLCAIDFDTNSLSFSGAMNSLIYIRNNELVEIKGDKQPIGLHSHKRPFTKHQLTLQKGDMLYLSTDGFPDQFGGEKGKKFMQKRFKELLLKISTHHIEKQKQVLQKEFISWKGDLEQLDDICVIGIEI